MSNKIDGKAFAGEVFSKLMSLSEYGNYQLSLVFDSRFAGVRFQCVDIELGISMHQNFTLEYLQQNTAAGSDWTADLIWSDFMNQKQQFVKTQLELRIGTNNK